MAAKKEVKPIQRVKVVAIARGHDGLQVREIGEVFTMPEEAVKRGATWFEPYEGKVRPGSIDAQVVEKVTGTDDVTEEDGAESAQQ